MVDTDWITSQLAAYFWRRASLSFFPIPPFTNFDETELSERGVSIASELTAINRFPVDHEARLANPQFTVEFPGIGRSFLSFPSFLAFPARVRWHTARSSPTVCQFFPSTLPWISLIWLLQLLSSLRVSPGISRVFLKAHTCDVPSRNP